MMGIILVVLTRSSALERCEDFLLEGHTSPSASRTSATILALHLLLLDHLGEFEHDERIYIVRLRINVTLGL